MKKWCIRIYPLGTIVVAAIFAVALPGCCIFSSFPSEHGVEYQGEVTGRINKEGILEPVQISKENSLNVE